MHSTTLVHVSLHEVYALNVPVGSFLLVVTKPPAIDYIDHDNLSLMHATPVAVNFKDPV